MKNYKELDSITVYEFFCKKTSTLLSFVCIPASLQVGPVKPSEQLQLFVPVHTPLTQGGSQRTEFKCS